MEQAPLEQQVIDARQQYLSPLDANLIVFLRTDDSFVVVYSGYPKYRHAPLEVFAFRASNDPQDTTPAIHYRLIEVALESGQTTHTFMSLSQEGSNFTISQASDKRRAPILVDGEPATEVKFKRKKELIKWDKKKQTTTPTDLYPIYATRRTGAVTVLLSTLLNSEEYVQKRSNQFE